MDKTEYSKVNFHTQLNTPEYYENQRLYAKISYVLAQTEKYGMEEEFQHKIDYYFQCLDKWHIKSLEDEKLMKEMTRRTGYKAPISEDSNLDHTYASRMSGISSDFILNQFKGYYYRSDASMPPKNENQEWLDTQEWILR